MPSSSRIIKADFLASLSLVGGAGDEGPIDFNAEGAPIDPVAERAALLEAAEAEAAAIREQAREVGYQEGLAAAEAEAADAVGRLVALANAATVEQAQWARAAEREVVGLAMLIAERVVQRHLDDHREVVVHAVQQGLQTLESLQDVRIRVHPDDVPYLEQAWTAAPDTAKLAAITPDERVQVGGCLIEAGESRIDLQPQTVLEAIGRTFREHWGDWS